MKINIGNALYLLLALASATLLGWMLWMRL